jgi:coiled-coil and C2 domain-containing protein 1
VAPTAAAARGVPGETRVGQQLAVVKKKQLEYRTAAVEAKRRGDLDKAKEYLRIARGFDPMIESLECGVRVDVVNVSFWLCAPIPHFPTILG